MVRPLRLAFASALYHITLRGDRQEDIYADDDDSDLLGRRLSEVSADRGTVSYSYDINNNVTSSTDGRGRNVAPMH